MVRHARAPEPPVQGGVSRESATAMASYTRSSASDFPTRRMQGGGSGRVCSEGLQGGPSPYQAAMGPVPPPPRASQDLPSKPREALRAQAGLVESGASYEPGGPGDPAPHRKVPRSSREACPQQAVVGRASCPPVRTTPHISRGVLQSLGRPFWRGCPLFEMECAPPTSATAPPGRVRQPDGTVGRAPLQRTFPRAGR